MTAYERANEFRKIIYDRGNTRTYGEQMTCCTEYIEKYNDFYDTLSEGGYNALMLACSNGFECIVHKLIEHGANVNITTAAGDTPLIIALRTRQNIDLIQLLIERGADVTTKTENGTVLQIAYNNNTSDTVMIMLIETGADFTDIMDILRYDRYDYDLREYIRDKYRKQIMSTVDDVSADNQLSTSFRTTYVPEILGMMTDYIV
ncbi:MAG: hypothetical protein Faunusvirus11_19 [Faunusvirus sp.]|jgi:ankyrin repeat protein|uniref:Uncharacterized protein n=1 Tax=Faunusvirus sp. TaxID=2487766 RepID=A0A3G4ZX09_9VIRU|nr:MAG: hypothetical protein Faunusvirus11_19 [Faunusvirus sp.]